MSGAPTHCTRKLCVPPGWNHGLWRKHQELFVRRRFRRLAIGSDVEFLDRDFDRHRLGAVVHRLNRGAGIRSDRRHFKRERLHIYSLRGGRTNYEENAATAMLARVTKFKVIFYLN